MRILCEVFGLFDKRGASGGGTPYVIKGACGLQRGGGAQANGWAQICAQREREGRKGEKRWEGGTSKRRKKHAKEERKRRKKRKKRNGNGTKMRKEGRMTRPSVFQNVNSLVVHSSSELRSTLKSPLLSAFLLNSRPL